MSNPALFNPALFNPDISNPDISNSVGSADLADRFAISPLIRFSLHSLYGSLTLPLLLLLWIQGQTGTWFVLMVCAVILGWGALLGSLSQKTQLDQTSMAIVYPAWVPGFLGRGWHLTWDQITDLSLSSTSQGGLAYYLETGDGSRYLLPLRVGRLRHLLNRIQAQTGLDTRAVNPYVQPWMYLWLAIASGILWLADAGILYLAFNSGRI